MRRLDLLINTPPNPIEALLRVSRLARTSRVVRIGDLEINLAAWKVSYEGRSVRLTSVEFRLLACLAKRVGQIVSYAEILEDIWGWDPDFGSLTQVKNCISRVRQKIEPDAHHVRHH